MPVGELAIQIRLILVAARARCGYEAGQVAGMLAVRGHGPRALPGTRHVAIPGQRPAPLGGICVADLRHVGPDFSAITSALFLTACEGPRRTSPAAGALVCLLVRGQAGGATVAAAGGATVAAAGGVTVDVRIAGGATVAAGGATVAAAGGVTVDVRTAAAGGAAAARAPAAAVAPPARLSPAIARAARLVRTDISVSLDDEEEPRDPRRLFEFSTN
jgi:hypothetical protein